MELSLGDVLEATGARPLLEPDGVGLAVLRAHACHAIEIDSRRSVPGDLFVALPGTQTDGARFAGDAFARGALAALTSAAPAISGAQRDARRATVGAETPFAALVVPDVPAALQQAARAWRARHDGVQVVGVTGSVGKTSTREAIAAVLSETLPTLVSERSYNNEIGLPLTLLRLERQHRSAVLEMGMYAPGEIAALCALARPQIGVVTMVAPVHLARLGSIEAIAAAKAELIAALPRHGVAVLNGDDPRVRAMAERAPCRAVFFGLGADNDWQARDVEDRGLQGFAFTLVHGACSARVETPIVGRHFTHALLAAAAVAAALELAPERIAAALGRIHIAERQRLVAGPRERLIIDDSWNASLPSMLAALDVLAAVPRRHVAVLGEMLELGAASEEAHRAVGRRAGGVAQALVTVGAGGEIMAQEARRAGLPAEAVLSVPSRAEASAALKQVLCPGDAVLVKGSRGLRLEETVRWLLNERLAVSD